jgi:hypothetical protein
MNTSELETLIRTILSEQLTTPAQTPVQPQGKGIFSPSARPSTPRTRRSYVISSAR